MLSEELHRESVSEMGERFFFFFFPKSGFRAQSRDVSLRPEGPLLKIVCVGRRPFPKASVKRLFIAHNQFLAFQLVLGPALFCVPAP